MGEWERKGGSERGVGSCRGGGGKIASVKWW